MTEIKTNRKRIFIVEDDRLTVIMIETILSKLGYDIAGVAACGEDVLKKVSGNSPDLILMDINLAGKLSGIEAATQVTAKFDIPIIYLSAFSDDEVLQLAKVTKPYGFLVKPIHDRELHATIEMAFYRNTMETKLRESEGKFKNLIENLPDAIFVSIIGSNNHGEILDVNPAAERQTGYSRDELIGLNLINDLVVEKFKESQLMEREEELNRGATIQFKEKKVRKDSTQYWTEVMISRIIYGNEKVALSVNRDITEKMKAEEQIKNQNVLLEKAVQKKQQEMESLMECLIRQEKLATVGKISGNIAHELRNPLGAIKQSVFFLNRVLEKNSLESSVSKVKEHLELIKTELDDSERVISDLLKSTKINPLEKRRTNLGTIILQVLDRQPLEKNIKLNINLQPEPFLIWADSPQLRQVFGNLISNAIQAIPGEGILTISAKMSNNNSKCLIKIKDNGPGIAHENLNKVFEPLYTSKPKGIGLGLSICKQIIENHGGAISMTSEIGKGATVNIELPSQDGEA